MNLRIDYDKKPKTVTASTGEKTNTKLKYKIGDLEDKLVVVTGIIPGMTRSKFYDKLIDHGAEPMPAITSKIDFLIVGNTKGNETTKLRRAEDLGIKIIKIKDLSY